MEKFSVKHGIPLKMIPVNPKISVIHYYEISLYFNEWMGLFIQLNTWYSNVFSREESGEKEEKAKVVYLEKGLNGAQRCE